MRARHVALVLMSLIELVTDLGTPMRRLPLQVADVSDVGIRGPLGYHPPFALLLAVYVSEPFDLGRRLFPGARLSQR
jgi:hypothetical protein